MSSLAWMAGAGLFLSALGLFCYLRLGMGSPTQMTDIAVARLIGERVVLEAGEANASDPVSVPGASDAWWGAVQADLARREYEASTTLQGLQAPNRAHNLRTTFGERGIEVVPRTGEDRSPAWRFAWETSGFGRAGRMEDVGPASPESEGSRVTYQREGWSEWYENTAKGLEQGFTIERKPAGEGPLRIVGDFPAALRAEVREDGAIDFIDGHGAGAIRYGELHVWDAQGIALSSELVLAGTELAIVVDDRNAEYPLTVDPLMTSPAWTAESNQASANFGLSVATAGDVNGDGFSDVIVGAYIFDNGETDEGRAFVYHGSASGLNLAPNWTGESNQAAAQFGFSVATAGDVNGDGYSDVIISAIRYDNGQTDEGLAFVYHGSASGVSVTPNWTAESDQAGALFGLPVGTAGDVNGDGFSDVIVGAFFYDNGETDEGRAFVYQGTAAGLANTPNWTAEGDQVDAQFGVSVGTAGDVNGDGFSDVIVGAERYDNGETDEGRTYVYHGSAGGLAISPAWTAESNQADARFGQSVGTAGDVNGDGFSDVIVSAYQYDNGQNNEGGAFVYQGAAAGLSTTPVWTAESDQALAARFCLSVATAGDVNGDGFSDVIVGVNAYDNGQLDEGRAYVYQGSAFGLASSPVWTAESNQASALFGFSVGTAGDVNGDGFSDVIVGAYGYDNGQSNEGQAFVYHGAAAGLAAIAAWTAESNQNFAFFGWSVATAGDVNGDGFSDVIVGAFSYDNGESHEGRAFVYHGSAAGLGLTPAWTAESNQADARFGYSVAGAGDVNGDGYSDVIVGAHEFDGGQLNEGRAFAYFGSAAGLAANPAWTAESNQAGAEFGFSVAGAGDVNGDGFSDVIVGAHFYDNDESSEGRAFAYHGSAAGLDPTPAWIEESDEISGLFGWSVATAGDVNGDGFSDVIVEAYQYDDGDGRVFAYHGSATGLATTPDWTAASDQIAAFFGFSIAAAGDVNGDGFSDVIVGAWDYDNGQVSEGRAFAYHGSAAGLGATPSWTAESNQAFAHFGISVATAGDVNGDGFSDVIVGAHHYDNGQTDEGRAFAYYGSAAGLATTPAWTAESNQANALFGYSVAAAGDVNGDGFSDVIVGANQYDNGQTDEGRAFVYYGNEGDGLDRIPRQARVDNEAPIDRLGRSDSPTSFRIKALGRTPAGRGLVRIQFEIEPFGTPFDGEGILERPFHDTGAPGPGGSAVPISAHPGGFDPNTLYHWRLRIATDSPFFPRSPWFTLAANALTEADVRTASPPLGVEAEGAPTAQLLLLEPVRPNPMRAHGEIGYMLPEAGHVRLTVVDVLGRVRAVLAGELQSAGRHTARWDGRDARGNALPAGVYLLRLETAGQATSRKLVIAR